MVPVFDAKLRDFVNQPNQGRLHHIFCGPLVVNQLEDFVVHQAMIVDKELLHESAVIIVLND